MLDLLLRHLRLDDGGGNFEALLHLLPIGGDLGDDSDRLNGVSEGKETLADLDSLLKLLFDSLLHLAGASLELIKVAARTDGLEGGAKATGGNSIGASDLFIKDGHWAESALTGLNVLVSLKSRGTSRTTVLMGN